MSMNGPAKQVKRYTDGRTKQSFRDECDIKKIMARAEKAGTISHLEKYEGVYADYSDYDFFGQTQQLTKGKQIFAELPAELRREFNQDPDQFFQFVNAKANKDKLRQKLPALAKPGDQILDVTPPDADTQAAQAAASEPASGDSTPTPPAKP